RLDLSSRRQLVLRQGPATTARASVARRRAGSFSSDQCAQHRTDGFLTMLLTPSDAKVVTDRLLARSEADHCIVRVNGSERINLRFARGSATTNGDRNDLRVTVESHFGDRAGAASVSGLDESALAAVVARSEEIARLAPENRELMPPVGPQTYPRGAG